MSSKLRSILVACGAALLLLLAGLVNIVINEKRKPILKLAVNEHASKEAQRLLMFLHEIQGKYTLSGQHDYLEIPDYHSDRVAQMTGEYPMVKGYEIGGIMNQTEKELADFRAEVVQSAKKWHRSGSFITISYHMNLPGSCYCWETINNGGISESQFEEIITPGTELNERHIADLDRTAGYLKQLRDAGIPVLWRPYHEMNGKWFWWGQQPRYAELWEIMYERYTNYHKLDNLIWVWSAATTEWADEFENYYVGAHRADVVAIDIYNNRYEQEYHDRLLKLAAGKPIAIGENGELPSVELLVNAQNQYVWFMTWAEWVEKHNDPAHVRSVYAHDRILTRDEIRRLKDGSHMIRKE